MADHVASIANKYGIDPNVFRALIGKESGGNQKAVSPKGAIGKTQLLPTTAAALGVNPHDPIGNLVGGAKYLRQQLDHFGGDYKKALAAYNAGPGAVEKYGGVPPYAETQNYVSSILSKAGQPAPAQAAKSSGSRSITTSKTTPGVDNSAARRGLILQFLQQRHNPQALIGLASGLQDAQDTPSKTTYSTKTVKGSSGPTASSASVKVAAGANQPGRDLTPGIQKVLRQVAGVAGPITVGTGTNHSKYTVDGNVSDHFTGNAADIPATGAKLTKLGQDALIAAGMPEAQARKQTGGLFNLPYGKHRRIQVIFQTQQGGDHTTHLHVGVTGR